MTPLITSLEQAGEGLSNAEIVRLHGTSGMRLTGIGHVVLNDLMNAARAETRRAILRATHQEQPNV